MALVTGATSVAEKKPGHDPHPHGNDHDHARVFAQLGHIKRAMHMHGPG
jgi:hypothetical protein